MRGVMIFKKGWGRKMIFSENIQCTLYNPEIYSVHCTPLKSLFQKVVLNFKNRSLTFIITRRFYLIKIIFVNRSQTT